MLNQFDAIERRIRDIFESSSSLLTGSDERALLIHRLCESLQAYFSDEENQKHAGNPIFHIIVHPEMLNNWKKQPDWEKFLVDLISSTAAEFGMQFTSPPQYKVTTRNSIASNEVIVSVSVPPSKTGETGVLRLQQDTEPVADESSKYDSSLILQGDKIVPLTKNVINIGRKSSNQIVINDLRVSRIHAQIRRIQEGYVIFDVGSTGGTFVNSQRINEKKLRSGDVISLAGYTMIYTEDQLVQEETNKTKTSEIKHRSQEENS